MRTVGMVAILALGVLLLREYRSYLKRRQEELSSFISLLVRIRKRISEYLEPVDEIVEKHGDERLSEIGFYDKYRDTGSLFSAFDSIKGSLLIREPVKQEIEECLRELGDGWREGELKRLDSFIESLKEEEIRGRELIERGMKTASALVFSVGMGLVLLIA